MGRRKAAARLVVAGWHFARGAARLGVRLAWSHFASTRWTPANNVGRTLAEVLERLGPTYIKVGQILSTRRDLFSEDFVRELARLQDRAPAPSLVAVRAVMEAELGAGCDQFAEFEPVPIANASIASVYKACLRDGRRVAVKVQRPKAARLIRDDLQTLLWIAGYLERLPFLRNIPLKLAVADFGSCLERQLDFSLEATANKKLRRALAVEPLIVIPALIDDLCGPSILTMEFVEAFHGRLTPNIEKVQDATRATLRALYRMIFVEGLVHCDLHWGNLHFFADGRAAMIDFGFMAEMQAADRLRFAHFFYAMATKDGVRCADITLETASFRPANLDRKLFEAEVVALVDRVSGVGVRDFQVSDFVTHLFDIQRRHGVVGTTAFTMAIVSLLVFEGIAKQTYPGLDFQGEAIPFVFYAATRELKTIQSRSHSQETESVELAHTG